MVVNELYYGSVWRDTIAPIKAESSGVSIDDDIIAAALRNIYRRDFNPHTDIEPNLFNAIAHTLGEAVSVGSGSAAPALGDDPFIDALRHSTDVFSAFKVHRAQNDMAAQLLDSNGNLKPFGQWKEEVLPIADHQCHNWLETEYNTAVLRARQAANWQQFQAEKDILPNLKWLPSTSPNPGADHRPFWNTILPIDHPFWNEHRPGDRWNCKCDLTSTDEPPTTAPSGSPAGNDPQPGLKDNPGKSQAVFSDDHPYYPKDCKHCPFYNPTLQARLSRVFKAQGKKGNCNSCPYVDNAVQTAKAETVPTDIRTHLLQLHELSGAEFSKKLTEIISRKEFKPVEGLKNIFSTGGEKAEDYDNLINGAKKAVDHGYTVYILPNPKGLRTGDYIFVRKNICKLFDLKTISGENSVGNRMKESIGQTNRVLLNMATTYDPRRLAQEIKAYFEANPEAKEVLIFKGKREISITRDMINKYFVQDFMKEYGK